MRSEFDANEALFQASLTKVVVRASNKSRQENIHKRECNTPSYWARQRVLMASGRKAFAVLTAWIV